MIQLGVIDANDMIIEAELDDPVYNIGLSWNQEGQLWTISIRDLDFSVLISGIAAVPGFPLLYQIRRAELPPGQLWIYSVNDKPLNRNSFVNGGAAFVYLTADDLETENA